MLAGVGERMQWVQGRFGFGGPPLDVTDGAGRADDTGADLVDFATGTGGGNETSEADFATGTGGGNETSEAGRRRRLDSGGAASGGGSGGSSASAAAARGGSGNDAGEAGGAAGNTQRRLAEHAIRQMLLESLCR